MAFECRYSRGAIAYSEWMAGFREGSAARFGLTGELGIRHPYAPNSSPSSSG